MTTTPGPLMGGSTLGELLDTLVALGRDGLDLDTPVLIREHGEKFEATPVECVEVVVDVDDEVEGICLYR